MTNLFPPLPLAGWQATRELLQGYARAAGRIRRVHASAHKHWWHACLYVTATGLREESGPVVLLPHHFNLAVLWFSGRLVPDQDPANAEYADEQMNFGFSTGVLKPKRPFSLERSVDPTTSSARRSGVGRGGGKRRNRTRIARILRINADIDAA